MYFGMILICGIAIYALIENGGAKCKYLIGMIILYLFWGTVDFFCKDIEEKNEKYEKLITSIYCLKIAEAANLFLLVISICCLSVANGEPVCCCNKS